MIDRLNFYDIYGHLLPGTLLVVLLGIPELAVDNEWVAKIPGGLLASLAVLMVGASYLAGLLIQRLGSTAVPSRFTKVPITSESAGGKTAARIIADGKGRAPSSMILDASDPTFSDQLRTAIGEKIRLAFGLEVSAAGHSEAELDRRRGNAIQLCRSTLVAANAARYAEQFQALYSLARASALALLMGMAYTVGFAISVDAIRFAQFQEGLALPVAIDLLGVACAIAALWDLRRGEFGRLVWWMLAFLVAGSVVAFRMTPSITVAPRRGHDLALLCVPYLLLYRQFLGAYASFAHNFAATVFSDFHALMSRPATGATASAATCIVAPPAQ